MALNQTHSYDTSDGLSLQQEVDQKETEAQHKHSVVNTIYHQNRNLPNCVQWEGQETEKLISRKLDLLTPTD